jgi:hypothetical protein
MVTVERDRTRASVEECLALAHGLDRGFNEASLDAMAESLPEQSQFLVFGDDDILGFRFGRPGRNRRWRS